MEWNGMEIECVNFYIVFWVTFDSMLVVAPGGFGGST